MKTNIKAFRRAHSSAQIVNSIDDLLIEIFLRLPIKSLVRFKLVSKRWHSLVTDQQFCLMRSNTNPNPAVGLFLLSPTDSISYDYVSLSINKSGNPPFRKLDFDDEPRGVRILQSCNGLLLCCSNSARECNKRYYVYNPTTKKFSTLPKLNGVGGISKRMCGMSLAFDPAKSPHYNVVCVRRLQSDSGEYRYQFAVYSSEKGPWRKWGDPYTAEVGFEKGVYWNGAIHWISNGTANSCYFDLERRALEIMPMPPIPDEWDWRRKSYFGESCGHLHYVEFFGAQIKFDVHEMKMDHSEWFVKYRVDLSRVVDAYPEMIRDYFDPTDWYYYAFTIFNLVRGEREEDSFLALHIPGKVVRYNLVCKTFETMHEFEFEGGESEGSLRFPNAIGFQYIESLCCV
ncbi:hypothetical protein ACP275_06G124300 [Erythranthe tilingii]